MLVMNNNEKSFMIDAIGAWVMIGVIKRKKAMKYLNTVMPEYDPDYKVSKDGTSVAIPYESEEYLKSIPYDIIMTHLAGIFDLSRTATIVVGKFYLYGKDEASVVAGYQDLLNSGRI